MFSVDISFDSLGPPMIGLPFAMAVLTLPILFLILD